MLSFEDTETPKMYIVNHNETPEQVVILKNEITDIGFSTSEEVFDLNEVTVTEEEIVIGYQDQAERFKRLSSSVVENEDKVQYQYIDSSRE